MFRDGAAALAFALVASTVAVAQDPVTSGTSIQLRGAETGRVRGVVFDSLVMRSVPRAVVTLVGLPKPAITDTKGRFSFDNVPVGERTLLFASPDIDSLGFGALGATVTVRSRGEADAYISSPSLRTLWNRLCVEATPLSTDSGIVWGTIRDAASLQARPSVSAEFRWYDLDSTLVRGLRIHDTRKEVVTDNAGLFFACGLPTNVAVTSEAIDSSAASGLLEYALGERRLLRLDMLVSRDMIVSDSTKLLTLADTMASMYARGLATVRGTILDEKNRPLNNAVISLPSVGKSVRTNGRGQFILSGLPAGSHSLEIRRLGYGMRTHLVSLRPNEVTAVSIALAGLNLLSTYNVRAHISKGMGRLAFEARRKLGTGMYLEGRELSSRRYMEEVLRTFPRAELRYDSIGGYSMTILSAKEPRCAPQVWVDDMHSSLSVVTLYQPEYFRAVELYNRLSEIPLRYQEYPEKEFPCAVMLFWSKSAKW